MASFIFEEGTQAQASNFTNTDSLIFKNATPSTLGLVYTPAANLTSVDTITLTSGTLSLAFPAAALQGNTHLSFLSGGILDVASNSATAGDTLVFSNDSASALYGLAGDDTLAALSGKGAHYVDLGDGNDHVTVAAGTSTDLSGAYVINGGAGADTINAAAATGSLHIYGGSVTAPGATDGADLITIGRGAVAAGAVAAAPVSIYVQGNAGNDTVTIGTTSAGVAGDFYRINGGGDNDVLDVSNENSLANSLVNGNKGNDSIIGGAGQDVLHGGQGNDTIIAGVGNSQLFGDLGDDSIQAGSGIDVITGGAGNDVFSFVTVTGTTAGGTTTFAGTYGSAANTNHLTTTAASDPLFGYVTEIKDFTTGQDKIILQNFNTTFAANTAVASSTVAANILTQGTATFGTEKEAQTYAQQLLDAAGADAAGKHNVAAIQVGGDVYLFSHEASAVSATTTAIDTVIKLDSVTVSNVKATDFV